MVKADFNKQQIKDILGQIKNLREEVNELTAKNDYLSRKLDIWEPIINNIEKLKNPEQLVDDYIKKESKTLVKAFDTKVQTKVEKVIDVRLGDFMSYKNKIEEKIRELQANSKPIDLASCFYNIHASLGLVVSGSILKLNKFKEDAEMIYGLKVVFDKVTQPPYKIKMETIHPNNWGED
jgi:hypothetical protein